MNDETTTTTAAAAAPEAAPAPQAPRIKTGMHRLHQFLEEIKDKFCYVWDPITNAYLRDPLGSGTTPFDAGRIRLKVGDCLRRFHCTRYEAELVDQDCARRLDRERVKSCNFSRALPELAAMLKTSPLNPTYRAILSARTGRPVPEELKTWEEVEDWASYNYHAPSSLMTLEQLEATPPPPPNGRPPVFFAMVASAVEFGTCNYNVGVFNNETFQISADRMMELVENSDDIEGLLDSVLQEYGESDPGQNGYDNYEEYEHTDYESDHTEDDSYGFRNRAAARTLLVEYLRGWLSLEERERLGI